MDKDGFMNLLFTHKEFPAVAPNVIFWLLHRTVFPGWVYTACKLGAKKFKSCVVGLTVNGCTPGMTSTGRLTCPIF